MDGGLGVPVVGATMLLVAVLVHKDVARNGVMGNVFGLIPLAAFQEGPTGAPKIGELVELWPVETTRPRVVQIVQGGGMERNFVTETASGIIVTVNLDQVVIITDCMTGKDVLLN